MSDLSPVTGSLPYSGSWMDIKNICRALNIGEGKLSKITKELVNFFQERVDREIDAILDPYYYTPLQPFNQKQASGQTVSVFPGNIRTLALYWTAGRLLVAEFQQNEPNLLDAGNKYINDARTQLYEIIKFNEVIPGQRKKSRLRTMPPTFEPTIPRDLDIT